MGVALRLISWPITFLLSISDISDCIGSFPRLYADKASLLVDSSSPTELNITLTQNYLKLKS